MSAAVEPSALEAVVSRAVAARMVDVEFAPVAPVTRAQAMGLSVINRSRDLLCGVLSRMPFQRWTEHGVDPLAEPPRELPVGWLRRPDPTRTRAAWMADVVDDLFFHGWAACRITSRSADSFPNALQYLEWRYLTPPSTHRAGRPGVGGDHFWEYRDPRDPTGGVQRILEVNVVDFESPVTGVLEAPAALWIAARLDGAASRFASTTLPAGTLEQTEGEPLTAEELGERVDAFEAQRLVHMVAGLSGMKYTESQIDPSRLQLVEGRQFQDAQLARVANVPGFMVGAVIPGDSMTYRTAATARLDLIDFGCAPLIECIEATLSGPDVTPRGQLVRMDPSPFLRSTELAGINDAPLMPVAAPQGAAR